jgi:hypothetical protein
LKNIAKEGDSPVDRNAKSYKMSKDKKVEWGKIKPV